MCKISDWHPLGCASLSVVFAQRESSLSVGFGKSKDEVKTALLTGVLFVSFLAYLVNFFGSNFYSKLH